MNEEVLRQLYQSAQKYFSMPSFEQFQGQAYYSA